jgi:hypothetical protein
MAVEDVRYGSATGEPEDEPSDYGDAYRLPAHRQKLLERRFPHPLDARIVFYEKPHVYTINGQCASGSVSSLIKSYVGEFDADRIIQGMQFSRREAWPRYKYAVNPRQATAEEVAALRESSPLQLALLVSDTESFKTEFAGPIGRCALPVGEQAVYLIDRAMTTQEIKLMWDNPEARNRGTEAHYQMELWMNSDPSRVHQPEAQVGLGFVRDQLAANGIRAYRTEWEICAEAESVAGSVDFVGVLPDDTLVIVDWKRSPKLQSNMLGQYGKRMRKPFDHLDDCDGAKYAIQLSAYAWILETYYGKKVTALALCSLHPESPFHTWVPYLKLEVDALMSMRRELVARKIALEFEEDTELPRCEITGNVAFEAVRDSKGRLCNEKELSIREEDCEFVPCAASRKLCADRLKAVTVASSNKELAALASRSVPWRERMPADGIPHFEDGKRCLSHAA